MYKLEKIWGSFEFAMLGTREIESENLEESETYIEASLILDGAARTIEVLAESFILLKNARKVADELKQSVLTDRFYQLNSDDFRMYVVPSAHEIDINTPDGQAAVYESEYGEMSPYVVIAISLDRDEEYDEIYPYNKFIPNMQVELEYNESVRLVEYICKRIDEILRIRIN